MMRQYSHLCHLYLRVQRLWRHNERYIKKNYVVAHKCKTRMQELTVISNVMVFQTEALNVGYKGRGVKRRRHWIDCTDLIKWKVNRKGETTPAV